MPSSDIYGLSCYENQLPKLDISKNTNLTVLDCASNQIEILDVSPNTALTYLSCASNKLISLDVSPNTALVNLICAENQLTSLIISPNNVLSQLHCAGNQLTDIDISMSTALTEFNGEGNQLTELIVRNGNNTNFTFFAANNNNLSCITVDDVTANHSTWLVDAGVRFSNDCDLTGDLQFLVSTNSGLKLVDDVGNAINYISSNSRNVEVYNNHIYVLGTEQNIEEYNAQGNYIRSIPIPSEVTYYLDFTVLPNTDFALYDNSNDKIYFINSQGGYLATVDMLNSSSNLLQNADGVVVDNSLIISDNGNNELIVVDLQDYQTSIFRDLTHRPSWLGAIDYNNGTYYICQSTKIWAFTEGGVSETLISTLPEGNITGIVVVDNYAYVTVNFPNRVYKVDISSGDYEIFAEGLLYAQDIEIIPVPPPPQINGEIAFASINNNSIQIMGKITIYPNPVVDVITITHQNESVLLSDMEVVVYDSWAVSYSLKSSIIQSKEGFELDLSGLASGNYILHISDGKALETFRIQKE